MREHAASRGVAGCLVCVVPKDAWVCGWKGSWLRSLKRAEPPGCCVLLWAALWAGYLHTPLWCCLKVGGFELCPNVGCLCPCLHCSLLARTSTGLAFAQRRQGLPTCSLDSFGECWWVVSRDETSLNAHWLCPIAASCCTCTDCGICTSRRARPGPSLSGHESACDIRSNGVCNGPLFL